MTRSSNLRSWLITSIAPGKRASSAVRQRFAVPEEPPHDVDAPALSSRQGIDVGEQDVLAEPDPLSETGDLPFEAVSARSPVSLLEIGERGDRLRGRVRAHGPLGLVQFLVEDVEPACRQHMENDGGLQPHAPCRRSKRQKAVYL